MLTQGTNTTFKGFVSGTIGGATGGKLGLVFGGPVRYFIGLLGGAALGHLADKDGD